MKNDPGSSSGLTKDEEVAMSHLVAFWNEFISLERQHPDEVNEAITHVHALQAIMASRVVARKFPRYWTNFKRVSSMGDARDRCGWIDCDHPRDRHGAEGCEILSCDCVTWREPGD